jgi:hypothetical protein
MRVDYPIAIDNSYAIWCGSQSEMTIQKLPVESGIGRIGHVGFLVGGRNNLAAFIDT